MAVCIQHMHYHEVSSINTKPIRKVPVRTDILDASSMVDRHLHANQDGIATMPVFVTVSLVEWYKRLGDEVAIQKLKKTVNLGVTAMKHNGGDRKSNFFGDTTPAEYLTVERYSADTTQPGLIIDFIPLLNAKMLHGDW